MKALTILANFSIMAEVKNEHYMKNIFGILRCFCEVEANEAHMDIYKITPESFWEGMNSVPDLDFIQLLKDNSDSIPTNVLADLERFKSRFGIITLVGDDCLKISNEDVLSEIKHNTKINEMIYEYDGNLVFFAENIKVLQTILRNDLFCPIKFRSFKVKTYLLYNGKKYTIVKGTDHVQAIKSLYGIHPDINESSLRQIMNYKKAQVTEEDITEFSEHLVKNFKDHFVSMITISDKANRKPFNFT